MTSAILENKERIDELEKEVAREKKICLKII
jgi:hypothetical protein